MTDQRHIDEAIEQHLMGEVIDDLQARVIANAWHGGQSSALYSFVSTGTITVDTLWEVERVMLAGRHRGDGELEALAAYLREHMPREQPPGWDGLSW